MDFEANELLHAQALVEKLEYNKLKLSPIIFDEFNTLLELAAKVVTEEPEDQQEAINELESYLR